MARKSMGGLNRWRRDMAGKYVNRSSARPPLLKPKVSKAHPKRLFGCVGGPFDGNKVWLSCGLNAKNGQPIASTLPFRVGTWCGRYVFDVGTNINDGSRKVVWEDVP